MEYRTAVLTVSDRGSQGLRADTAGDAVCRLLTESGWNVAYRSLFPDELEQLEKELIYICDDLKAPLAITVGGTGFSPRDITPEATLAVAERAVPGIPEAMRRASMEVTPNGMLSRSACGIRGRTLILNLPGSEKAAVECLSAVLGPLRHGVEILTGNGGECGAGRVLAVCVSGEKGVRKRPVPEAQMKEHHGILGDAHAGSWHRQISLLAVESVRSLQEKTELTLDAGIFAENILTEGIVLKELPPGAKLRIGSCLCRVTQIGKECHSGCAVRRACGACVMPLEGIFAEVLDGGIVKAGDEVRVET